MIFENASELSHGQVTDDRANCLESGVARSKDSNVFQSVYGTDKVGLTKSSGNRGKTGCNSGERNVLWESKNGINDMDNATGEVVVLYLSASMVD